MNILIGDEVDIPSKLRLDNQVPPDAKIFMGAPQYDGPKDLVTLNIWVGTRYLGTMSLSKENVLPKGRTIHSVKKAVKVKEVFGKHLPTDAKERKGIPLYSGVMKYFPDALVEVAKLSKIGNDQHNPGQPLHWAREKSTDQEDTLLRHLLESGTIDTDGVRHSAKVAWRALALLQLEIEASRKVSE